MISTPHTYPEWVDILDLLKQKLDDAEVMVAMRNGTIEWQSGVTERFARRLINVIYHRMNMATDKFQKDMARGKGQENMIIQALLDLRKELAFLVEVIELPALPEVGRKQCRRLIIEQADHIQKSLEDSAQKDHSGKVSKIVRDHKVNVL